MRTSQSGKRCPSFATGTAKLHHLFRSPRNGTGRGGSAGGRGGRGGGGL